jgi:hypothetical protein
MRRINYDENAEISQQRTGAKRESIDANATKRIHVVMTPWAVEPISTTTKTSGSGCHGCDDTLVAATTHKNTEQRVCRVMTDHTT